MLLALRTRLFTKAHGLVEQFAEVQKILIGIIIVIQHIVCLAI